MKYRITRLTKNQLSKCQEYIHERNLNGSYLDVNSLGEAEGLIAVLRAAEVHETAGDLRIVRGMVMRIQDFLDSPSKHLNERAGELARLQHRKEAQEAGGAVSLTKGQTLYFRDLHKISGVEFMSPDAQKTGCFIRPSKRAEVTRKVRDLMVDEVSPHNRRIISTFAKKMSLDVNPTVMARKAYNSTSSETRLDMVRYIMNREGIKYNEHCDQVEEIIKTDDIPVVIRELKILASYIHPASDVAYKVIADLEACYPKEQSDYLPPEPEYIDRREIVPEIRHRAKPAPEMREMNMPDVFDGPTQEELDAIEAELEAYEPEMVQEVVVFNNQKQDKPEPEVAPEEDEGPNCFFEESWGELESYDEGDEDDEDDDCSWFVYSSMKVAVEQFGKDQLEQIADGAVEWDGDDIIFKDPDMRNQFCASLQSEVDQLLGDGEITVDASDLMYEEIVSLELMESLV